MGFIIASLINSADILNMTDTVPKHEDSKQRKNKEGHITAENELRVQAKGQIKNYLGYAFRILNKTDHRSLTIRATGNAIVKALILIELVKRRVGELHQLNKIYSMEIVSHEESKIEGMEKIETRRRVTAMDTTPSKDKLDTEDPGYWEPLPKEEQAAVPAQNKEDKKKNQNKLTREVKNNIMISQKRRKAKMKKKM